MAGERNREVEVVENREDRVEVGPIEVCKRATRTGTLSLPGGTTPTALEVVAREHVDGDPQILVADTVELAVSS